ncbi:MAG: sigma-70 family RNA polymerase sigma factor [Clostridiaceae bacterium]|nr:sigma-70 family RNA polymerase sigma factor [Clostridiaceae bacterium]
MRKLLEIKEELSKITDEDERLKYFENLVKEFDEDDRKNDRKHFRSEKRHSFNITNMDTNYDPDNTDTYIPKELTAMCHAKYWDELIFSQQAEDMHELVTDRALSNIISRQTKARKEALFYRVVKGYTAGEISALQGVSERNIRKLYQKALQNIREELFPVIRFKRKLETMEEYKETVQERDIYTTSDERRFLDKYNENS